jgi:hypothetical protein
VWTLDSARACSPTVSVVLWNSDGNGSALADSATEYKNGQGSSVNIKDQEAMHGTAGRLTGTEGGQSGKGIELHCEDER